MNYFIQMTFFFITTPENKKKCFRWPESVNNYCHTNFFSYYFLFVSNLYLFNTNTNYQDFSYYRILRLHSCLEQGVQENVIMLIFERTVNRKSMSKRKKVQSANETKNFQNSNMFSIW